MKIKVYSRWNLIRKTKYYTWILFGQKRQHDRFNHVFYAFYTNIYQHVKLVQGCFCYGIPIEKLEFSLAKNQMIMLGSYYYGWINFKKNSQLESVWHSLIQCKMCLSSDYKIREKNGEGILVKLNVKSLGEIDTNQIQKTVLQVTNIPAKEEKNKESDIYFTPIRKIQW